MPKQVDFADEVYRIFLLVKVAEHFEHRFPDNIACSVKNLRLIEISAWHIKNNSLIQNLLVKCDCCQEFHTMIVKVKGKLIPESYLECILMKYKYTKEYNKLGLKDRQNFLQDKLFEWLKTAIEISS